MNSHPRLAVTQPEAVEYASRAVSPSATVAMTNARMKPTEVKKISGSVLSQRNFVRFFPSAPTSWIERGLSSPFPVSARPSSVAGAARPTGVCSAGMESWGFIRGPSMAR